MGPFESFIKDHMSGVLFFDYRVLGKEFDASGGWMAEAERRAALVRVDSGAMYRALVENRVLLCCYGGIKFSTLQDKVKAGDEVVDCGTAEGLVSAKTMCKSLMGVNGSTGCLAGAIDTSWVVLFVPLSVKVSHTDAGVEVVANVDAMRELGAACVRTLLGGEGIELSKLGLYFDKGQVFMLSNGVQAFCGAYGSDVGTGMGISPLYVCKLNESIPVAGLLDVG